MPEKKRTFWKTLVKVLLIIIVAAALYVGIRILSVYLRTRDYYAASEKAFLYPELKDGFIPQGIEYDSGSDCFFICGYMSGKDRPSPIYVINRSDGSLRASASMLKADGSVFRGHSGGIAIWDGLVYVAGTYDGLYVFSRDDVLASRDGSFVRALGLFPLTVGGEKITSSFVEAHDGILTVGEFRMPVIAETGKSHHFRGPSGKMQKAVALNYKLDSSYPLGISPEPFSAYSIPTLAQGMFFEGDKILVSASIAFFMSKIHVYDSSSLEVCGTFGGLPVYSLDSSAEREVMALPPMAEEIIVLDNWLYCMGEFAAEKYQIGKLFDAQWCWRTRAGSGPFGL